MESYQIRPVVTALDGVILQFYDLVELRTFLFLYSLFSRISLKKCLLTWALIFLILLLKLSILVVFMHLIFMQFLAKLDLSPLLRALYEEVDGKKIIIKKWRVLLNMRHQAVKQGFSFNQSKATLASRHKYEGVKFSNANNKTVKSNKHSDWGSISNKNFDFYEYDQEAVKTSLKHIQKIEPRKPLYSDEIQRNFDQEKINAEGGAFNSDGAKAAAETEALRGGLKGSKGAHRSKSLDDGPFSSGKTNFSDCPSGSCELKWGEYDKRTKIIKFWVVKFYKSFGLKKTSAGAHPALIGESSTINFSSSTKAAEKNPNVEVIGTATPKDDFKLEHINGSEGRASVLLIQENDDELTKFLENNSDEIARYERHISLKNFARYIYSNNGDDQIRFNKVKEGYEDCKESLVDDTNELYAQLPSLTLAESLIKSANDLGEIQLKYLASLKCIDFFVLPCPCIKNDVEVTIKEEVIREVKAINNRTKADLKKKEEAILNEFKDTKDGGGMATHEDVFTSVFDRQVEVLNNFKQIYSSETHLLLNKAILIPKFSRFSVEFTKKLMSDFELN